MSQSCETTRVPGASASRRGRSCRLTSGSRYIVTTLARREVGREQVLLAELDALGHAGGARRVAALLHQLGHDLDAEAAGAEALRRGDDDAAVAGAEIDHVVGRADAGELEHRQRHLVGRGDEGHLVLTEGDARQAQRRGDRAEPEPPRSRLATARLMPLPPERGRPPHRRSRARSRSPAARRRRPRRARRGCGGRATAAPSGPTTPGRSSRPASRALDQRVDLLARADVDAARRLVADQQQRLAPAAPRPNSTFCWLPPLSARDRRVAATPRPASAARASAPTRAPLLAPSTKPQPREAGERRGGGVAQHRQAGEQAVALAVLGQVDDAASEPPGAASGR